MESIEPLIGCDSWCHEDDDARTVSENQIASGISSVNNAPSLILMPTGGGNTITNDIDLVGISEQTQVERISGDTMVATPAASPIIHQSSSSDSSTDVTPLKDRVCGEFFLHWSYSLNKQKEDDGLLLYPFVKYCMQVIKSMPTICRTYLIQGIIVAKGLPLSL